MSLFPLHLTVRAGQRAVEYVDGAFRRELGPGRHRRPRRSDHVVVVTTDRVDTTAPQEVLTADGVAVRVTAAVRWGVTDARAFVESALDAQGIVYLAVQVALREALAEREAEALVRMPRAEVGAALTEAAARAGAEVGIAVRGVVVKDVILPPEVRSAYAGLATARVRGQAQLEAARAETAALRSLANGARLLDESPSLARLRLVQALPPGSTVELTSGG